MKKNSYFFVYLFLNIMYNNNGDNVKNKELLRLIICSIIYVVCFFIKNDILLYITYIFLSYDVVINVYNNLKDKEIFDENLLMLIATIGAILIKETKEAVAVMLFYQIGEYLSDLATDKSKKNITDLLDLQSEYVLVRKNNKVEKVETKEVKIGDTIVVKPGVKIPLDGIILKGKGNIDTKSITGESKPKVVKENDEVLSGMINLDSVLEIKVLKTLENSTSTIILNLILNSCENKAKYERFITRFAKIYTPIVVLISLLLFIFPLILKQDMNIWIYKSLLFLVTSCPCALVISVPLCYFLAISLCSKNGVIIKSADVIDKLPKIKTILFDKTGTLTKGNFKITKVVPLYKKEEEVLKYAAYAEYNSNHPIACAIKNEYKEKIDEKLISDYKEISGKGISLKVNDDLILVGNSTLFEEKQIKYPKIEFIGTTVLVSLNNEYIGTIVISDEIKEESISIVEKLKQIGIKRVLMLSGDNIETVKKVGNKLKMDECYANLLPNDKFEILKEIETKEKTIFVGDGINDALVLMESDVGISMGNLGSEIAVEASDMVIFNDNLNEIVNVIDISNKTNKMILFNIIFAIGIKILVMILGLFGITNMWMAVLADVGVTIFTVLNSFRINRFEKKI